MSKFYTNSKGQPVEIEGMLHPHLTNAINKLERQIDDDAMFQEGDGPHPRQGELDAMRARKEVLDAEYQRDGDAT